MDNLEKISILVPKKVDLEIWKLFNKVFERINEILEKPNKKYLLPLLVAIYLNSCWGDGWWWEWDWDWINQELSQQNLVEQLLKLWEK